MMAIGSEKKRIYRYTVMFGFGVGYMILMVIQNALLPQWLFIVVQFLELIGVYFLIKRFVKQEEKENDNR